MTNENIDNNQWGFLFDELKEKITPEELEKEFIKAGKRSIHSIAGSQQRALKQYIAIVAAKSKVKSVLESMEIIYNRFEASNETDFALYLNTKMMEAL